MQSYREAMQQYQPGVPLSGWGSDVFVEGALLQKIAPQLPANPTSGDFVAAMYSLHGETLGGLLPGITFNRGEHVDVNHCIVPGQLKDGHFVPHDLSESFVCDPGWKPGT